jgi:hypothetical protein
MEVFGLQKGGNPMSWLSKTLGIALFGAVMAVPSMAQVVVVGRPFVRSYVVGPRLVVRPYGYWGPAWGGYWGPGYAWGPGYYGYPYSYPQTGKVEIETHLKDASVYVDGGYVGPVKKFHKFWLAPGNHNVELRDLSGHSIFSQKVTVILDKTVELRPPA